ncbi:filamin-binding LIM protein 1 [Lithobates pipiens]
MSGKRMVSSVTITLAPPWRAEISQKDQTNHQSARSEPRRTESPPATLPDLEPPPEESWSDQEELRNGGLPSFTPTFLDEMPPEDDCLSPDLPPPPPPPPVHTKTPIRFLDPAPPPPPPPDSLSLELEKLELAFPTSQQKAATPPASNPVKPQFLPTTTQQRREETVPGKQNGYSGRPESSETCAFCHKAILPTAAAIEAMKKQYHASCFTCRKCHRLLAGQLYYQKDGRPICEHCYKDTLEKCATCQTLIMQHIVRAMGNSYHPECFRCVVCHRTIADESFAVDEYNDVHCAQDYYRKYAPICNVCEEPIIPRDGQDSYKIECIGRNFHENCYRCEKCRVLLSLEPTESGCYPLDGHILCKSCHLSWKDELS